MKITEHTHTLARVIQRAGNTEQRIHGEEIEQGNYRVYLAYAMRLTQEFLECTPSLFGEISLELKRKDGKARRVYVPIEILLTQLFVHPAWKEKSTQHIEAYINKGTTKDSRAYTPVAPKEVKSLLYGDIVRLEDYLFFHESEFVKKEAHKMYNRGYKYVYTNSYYDKNGLLVPNFLVAEQQKFFTLKELKKHKIGIVGGFNEKRVKK